jgi:hypothetical protein
LQRKTPKKGARGGRRWTIGLPRASSVAADVSGAEESELEPLPGKEEGPLKWKTVNVYNAAIAELYHYQVSIGLNNAPTFRGLTHKALMKGLSRQQDQRARNTFEDRGARGIDSGYS